MDRQNAAHGSELNTIPVWLVEIQYDIGRGQRCMAAQLHLRPRCEPAQMIACGFFHDEGRLRQIVLHSQLHHGSLRRPALHHADGGRISGERLACKGVDNILFHGHAPS